MLESKHTIVLLKVRMSILAQLGVVWDIRQNNTRSRLDKRIRGAVMPLIPRSRLLAEGKKWLRGIRGITAPSIRFSDESEYILTYYILTNNRENAQTNS